MLAWMQMKWLHGKAGVREDTHLLPFEDPVRSPMKSAGPKKGHRSECSECEVNLPRPSPAVPSPDLECNLLPKSSLDGRPHWIRL